MADAENIGIDVGIALLARLGAEIYTSHGCGPPSWIFPLPFIGESVQENIIEFAVSYSNKNVAWLV